MLTVDIQNESDSDWNSRMLQSKTGNVYQTKEYASFKKRQLRYEPLFLKFHSNNGELVGQTLVFQSFKGRGKIARIFGRGQIYSTIAKASRLFPKFVTWSYGPVVFNEQYEIEILESMFDLLNSWNCQFSGTTHPLGTNEFPQKNRLQKEEAGTFIIDLRQDLQRIFDNTDKKSVRKNIERSQERGVSVTQIRTEKDRLANFELRNQHRIKNKLPPIPKEDMDASYEIYKPLNSVGFLAWYEGAPIATISMTEFNGYVNEAGIARSDIDAEKKLYSVDLLRWKIIETSVHNSYKYYDLTGIKLDNRSTKEHGIFRNKEKWGGKLCVYWTIKN